MRKSLMLGLVCASVMGFVGAALADDAPLLAFSAPKFDAPIKVDGVLDDAGWLTASAFGGKAVVDLGNDVAAVSGLPRVVYFGYDDKNLDVAFVIMTDKALVSDSTDWWNDDECEIFLAPDDSGYGQIGINTAGVVNGTTADWDFTRIQAKVGKVGIAYYIEMAIPFDMMGMKTPKPGDTMKANFCGHQLQPDIWVSANAMYGGFHNPDKFSTLTFK